MIETITISDVAKILNYKRAISAVKWCIKNNITILSEEGSNKKRIVRSQFEYIRLKKFIQLIKYEHKENWSELLDAYEHEDMHKIFEIEEQKKTGDKANSFKYQPQGQHEKSFLTSLLNETHEL